MIKAVMQQIIDYPWTSMEPLHIGPAPSRGPSPDAYIAVWRDDKPILRIDAYCSGSGAFEECVTWRNYVVVGRGEVVHLIDLRSLKTQDIPCDGYFGHLYPLDELLLIATASEVICIDADGRHCWRQESLGIDGVVINAVRAGMILGEGEWDPPGGWRPFKLSLATGSPVAD